VIIRSATMKSRFTMSILQTQLNDIDTYAAGVTGDVEKITGSSQTTWTGLTHPGQT
jgi:hypothetical protein